MPDGNVFFPEPQARLRIWFTSQDREITACAFRNSGGAEAFISDEITLTR